MFSASMSDVQLLDSYNSSCAHGVFVFLVTVEEQKSVRITSNLGMGRPFVF